MRPGSSIIGSSSVNSDMPSADARAVRGDEGGDRQLHRSLAQLLGRRGSGSTAWRPDRSGRR
jgi:hypothetical protein